MKLNNEKINTNIINYYVPGVAPNIESNSGIELFKKYCNDKDVIYKYENLTPIESCSLNGGDIVFLIKHIYYGLRRKNYNNIINEIFTKDGGIININDKEFEIIFGKKYLINIDDF